MKRTLAAIIVAAVLVFGLWIVAVPQSMLSATIVNSFQGTPFSIDLVGLQKGPFYNVRIAQIVLKKSGATILSVDNASGRLSFSSLLKLTPGITFHGDIAGGTLKGKVNFSKAGHNLDIVLDKVHLEKVPFFNQAGLAGKAVISGEYTAKNDKGNLKFNIEDADIGTASFGGVPVPLSMFDKARGAVETNSRMIRIISFAMEGKKIYARIKGDINGRMLNLTMEIMPEASLEAQDMMFKMIRRYEVSPGHYSIPIRSAIPF